MSRAGSIPINRSTRARNLFANSDMELAQRGGSLVSLSTAGNGAYYLDRWQSRGFPSITGGQTGQSSLPPSFPGNAGVKFANRMVGTCSAANANIFTQQKIESFFTSKFTTDKLSFGFWVWVSNFTQARLSVARANTVDNYTGATSIITSTIDITPSAWNFVKLENITIPALGLTNGLNCAIEFITPSNPTGAFDAYVTQAMANEGELLLPWERMFKSPNDELQYCQRFYEKNYSVNQAPGTNLTASLAGISGIRVNGAPSGTLSTTVFFKVEKRVTPSMVPYDATGNINRLRINAIENSTNGGIDWTSPTAFSIRGNSCTEVLGYWTADAEL